MRKEDIKKNMFLRMLEAGKVIGSRADQLAERKKKERLERRRKWIEEDLKQRGWKLKTKPDCDYDSDDWTY